MRLSRSGHLALIGLVLTASYLPASAVGARTPWEATDQVVRGVSNAGPTYAGVRGAFVHFKAGTRHQRDFLRRRGLRPVVALTSIDVVYAEGTSRAFSTISRDPRVLRLEANRQLPLLNESATVATRVQELRTPEAPYRSPSGGPIDGSGVGVAVLDTGILGTHPDLSTRMARNYKIVCDGCPLIETPVTDTTSGHGTHVAGIVAGTGAQSQGRFAGAAPGVSLYGYGGGETLYMLWAAVAFDHIVQHYDNFDPRIRVVTNSYGRPREFDPDSTISRLVGELVDRGTTVVWAAGNSGGNGSADRLVSDAKNPLPGVISVGNYDDLDSGSRDGLMYSSSSRGRAGSPETYPDVVAPGTHITSTCIQEIQPVCNLGFGVTTAYHPWYSTIQGTSMAAPHVAGIAALLYQAQPALTPAQVEDLLQDAAHKFADGAPYEPDPQNPGGTVSFDKGAGLVDAVAALELLQERSTTQPPRKKKGRRPRSPR
ncbi:MAG: S8 family serine peptidase [Actinomycetota bacterium]|nr:S8 family serine peptidase [Actinomycetota bacterium]